MSDDLIYDPWAELRRQQQAEDRNAQRRAEAMEVLREVVKRLAVIDQVVTETVEVNGYLPAELWERAKKVGSVEVWRKESDDFTHWLPIQWPEAK